ncbi:MAG: class I SAM-dependent methyltransferase [Gemmatimonadaceae bacterium]|nr:class I SAM-dependent methyltransferase [Gemmatimonadaceae bacterium]
MSRLPDSHADADPSHGWDDIADQFRTQRSAIGAATVRAWCRGLPARARVLDLGCGTGIPITATLLEAGCTVCGVDASPRMIAAFQRRFPDVPVRCETAESSSFFGQMYEGVVAIGLLFLLPPHIQLTVIHRVAAALLPGGRFLFTVPVHAWAWTDVLSGRESVALGDEAYRAEFTEAGLALVAEYVDEGENHYYDTVRTALGALKTPAGGSGHGG